MRLFSEYHPERCVSTDPDRPQLKHARLDVDNGVVVATNGHMLVAVPCDLDDEKDAQSRFLSKAEVDAARGVPLPQKADQSLTYPDWKKVIPPFKEGDEGTVTIGLSARYLYDLAQAIGARCDQVYVTFRVDEHGWNSEDPFIVRRAHDQRQADELALLMPLSPDRAEH